MHWRHSIIAIIINIIITIIIFVIVGSVKPAHFPVSPGQLGASRPVTTPEFPASSQHRAPDSLAIDISALYKFILHYISFADKMCENKGATAPGKLSAACLSSFQRLSSLQLDGCNTGNAKHSHTLYHISISTKLYCFMTEAQLAWSHYLTDTL